MSISKSKTIFLIICGVLIISPNIAFSQRGCCSGHGGVAGDKCGDGTPLSAKCGGSSGGSSKSETRTYDSGGSQKIQYSPVDIYIKKGYEKYKAKKYKEALLLLNQAMKLKKDNFNAYFTRGLIYYKLKKYNEGINDLNYAIHMNPSSSKCYINRGNIYYTTKRTKKACEDYEFACSLGNCIGAKWAKKKGICK